MCVFTSVRHPGGHERGVPEVRLRRFSAHPSRESRKRTGKRVRPVIFNTVFQLNVNTRSVNVSLRIYAQRKRSVLPVTHPATPLCLVQVFVEYANSSDSKEAQRLLTGRTFDGKFVVATFYPLSAYKRGYLYQTVQ